MHIPLSALRLRSLLPGVIALILSLLPGPFLAASTITWEPERSRMSAEVENQPLQQVLESLARSSGWSIYMEPATSHIVSTRFTGLSAPEALQHLLGNLNYALIPDPGGRARLYVFQTSAAGATQRILPASPSPSSSRIANELIVTLAPNAEESIEQIAARLKARVTGRADELRTYRLEFEDELAAERARTALEGMDSVDSIDFNHRLQPPPDADPLPLLAMPPLGLTPRLVPATDQIVIALLDTPIFADHPNLKDFLLPAISLSEVNPSAEANQFTHATAMAETILRALASLPQDEAGTPVRILPVDIYGPSGTTTTFDVARGLVAAAAAGPAFINLSLGSDTDSPFLHRLIQDLARQGTAIIAAAGNEPVATPVYPAAYPEVLAVTAADGRGQIAPYANYGAFVDVVAPGTALIEFDNRPYLGSGTSYATAHVTGIAAGLATTPNATSASILAFLREQFALPPSSGAQP
jgi:hypothetical protein